MFDVRRLEDGKDKGGETECLACIYTGTSLSIFRLITLHPHRVNCSCN